MGQHGSQWSDMDSQPLHRTAPRNIAQTFAEQIGTIPRNSLQKTLFLFRKQEVNAAACGIPLRLQITAISLE